MKHSKYIEKLQDTPHVVSGITSNLNWDQITYIYGYIKKMV